MLPDDEPDAAHLAANKRKRPYIIRSVSLRRKAHAQKMVRPSCKNGREMWGNFRYCTVMTRPTGSFVTSAETGAPSISTPHTL